MNQQCQHCHSDSVYLVDAGNLPPVPCPIMVLYEGTLKLVTRTGFISEKTREMEYQPLKAKSGADGQIEYEPEGDPISGRLKWTYP